MALYLTATAIPSSHLPRSKDKYVERAAHHAYAADSAVQPQDRTKAGFSSTPVPIYQGGVANAQSVGPHSPGYHSKLASFANIAYTGRMKTCNPKYADQIPDLIWRATGVRPSRLIPIPTIPDTIVYEAEMPTNPVIFKAIDPDGHDPDGIGLEAWMCERVRALGVPAPQILTVDTSRSALPASYFIMMISSVLLNLPRIKAEQPGRAAPG
jgi:hypothetical protein